MPSGWTTRGVGLKIPESQIIVIPFSISILSENQEQEIGYIQQINYSTTRRVERIRHLNMSDAGRVICQVPFPEDMTVNATGMALYNSTLISRLADVSPGREKDSAFAVFHCLNSQAYPFVVEIQAVHPADPGKEYTVIHGGCWLTNFASPYNQSNLYVSQTATFQPSWTEVEVAGTKKEKENSVMPHS